MPAFNPSQLLLALTEANTTARRYQIRSPLLNGRRRCNQRSVRPDEGGASMDTRPSRATKEIISGLVYG